MMEGTKHALTFYITSSVPSCSLTTHFPSPDQFTTAASCPFQTALLHKHLVPVIEVTSHANLQQLCDAKEKKQDQSHMFVFAGSLGRDLNLGLQEEQALSFLFLQLIVCFKNTMA